MHRVYGYEVDSVTRWRDERPASSIMLCFIRLKLQVRTNISEIGFHYYSRAEPVIGRHEICRGGDALHSEV